MVVRGEDELVALSRAAGEPQWTVRPEGTGRAVVTPGAAFLPGSDGQVIALGDE